MYIQDGIAYAGEPEAVIQVCEARALPDWRLWLRFNTGEEKIFDFKPLLRRPAFAPLADEARFREVGVDYGTAVWRNGDIDIDPEWLYSASAAVTAQG